MVILNLNSIPFAVVVFRPENDFLLKPTSTYSDLGILLVTGKKSFGKCQEISKAIFLETPLPEKGPKFFKEILP